MKERIVWAGVLLLVAAGFLGWSLPQQAKNRAALEIMEAELAALEGKAARLDEFTALAKDEKLGCANESFRVNRPVIVLSSDGKPEELKLTANWEDGGSVFIDCSSDAAELRFLEESWDRYTTMTVTPKHPGLTVARFSSDATKQSFAVWILVED